MLFRSSSHGNKYWQKMSLAWVEIGNYVRKGNLNMCYVMLLCRIGKICVELVF